MAEATEPKKPRTVNPLGEATREMARISVELEKLKKRLVSIDDSRLDVTAKIDGLKALYAEAEKKYLALRPSV